MDADGKSFASEVRVADRERDGWLGEIEGVEVLLSSAKTTQLGMPTFPSPLAAP
jgi:hypothetical protein